MTHEHGRCDQLRTKVKEMYKAVAQEPDGAFHFELGRTLALRLGYPADETPHGEPLQVRIGIDSGPVVAGVIGRHKFSCDVWGDTVNTASRIESYGVTGRVQVTERVAPAAEGRFDFEPRSSITIKGKGTMTTFLLVARKPTSSAVTLDAALGH